jgi:hypothetical protein
LGFGATTNDNTISQPQPEGERFQVRPVGEFFKIAIDKDLFSALDGVVVNVHAQSADYGWFTPGRLLLI